MMTGTYKIADKIILIESIYSGVHKKCADYACEGTPDFTVTITPEDIRKEIAETEQNEDGSGEMIKEFPECYLETLAVYRKIAVGMLKYNTFLFHGSAIELDGESYLFTAKSGTGKSTHTRLWRELYGDRTVMINDDKPLIRINEDGATVFGTPWDGKHHLSTNKSSPLKAICVLERGVENKIVPITPREAFPHAFVQTYRPKEGEYMVKTLSLIDELCKKVKAYRLECNMDIEAARIASEGMK